MLQILAGFAGLYALICAAVYFFQERLLFFPLRAHVATPAQVGLGYEDVWIDTSDGARLHAWHVPAPRGTHTLLFFHGNAGNISHRLQSVQQFNRLGVNVLIVDYRGYGQSTGRPTEPGLLLDAQAAWAHLIGSRGLEPGRIIVFGRSLGGAIAVQLAAMHTPGALVMESSFTSIPNLARTLYPWLPVRWLARLSFDSIEAIRAVRAPVLVAHGAADEVIPFEHGQALFAAAPTPKQFLELAGNHNDGFVRTGALYESTLAQFFRLAGMPSPE